MKKRIKMRRKRKRVRKRKRESRRGSASAKKLSGHVDVDKGRGCERHGRLNNLPFPSFS